MEDGGEDGDGAHTLETLALGSPFDYESQVRVIIDVSMPDPRGEGYIEALADRVVEHARATHGGAFVLFTSNQTMRRCAAMTCERFEDDGLNLIVQGEDGPKSLMLARFRSSERAVLFGVASFWQGVDVRGDALRNVVITRLPFEPPDRPLTEARLERIRELGGDPFFDDSLPRAVLRFKQGFGRLIRSGTDTGRVVILDPRVATKRYGRAFLDALPSGTPVELVDQGADGEAYGEMYGGDTGGAV